MLFCFISFGQSKKQIDLYENYKKALGTYVSTAPSFIVITFRNLTDNTINEVCIEAPDLIFAVFDELKLKDYNDLAKAFEYAVRKKDRFFEFSNPKSIERLTNYNYAISELNDFIVEKNILKLSKKIYRQKKWKFYPENELEKIKYAHSLFKFGIITGHNNCTGGMTLFCTNWSNE